MFEPPHPCQAAVYPCFVLFPAAVWPNDFWVLHVLLLQVPLQTKPDCKWLRVRCHDWQGDAIDEGDEVADWLSKFLQQRVRLVKYGGMQHSEQAVSAFGLV